MKKAIRIVAVLLLVAALAIPANAADFTPSIEQKGAPAVSVDGAGKSVQLTPLSESEKAADATKTALEEAYKSLAEAKSLDEVAPALTESLPKVAPTVKVEDLVVRDLVHVFVDQGDDEVTTLTFELDIDEDDVLIVMMYVDGEWVVLDPDMVTINADGTVSIKFTGKTGVLAFVTVKSE